MMVAGEASGDLHGARLLEAVHQMDPGIQFFGMGGAALKRTGMAILYSNESLSVVGITEVLLKLGAIRKALSGLKRALRLERPDLVILIDFPDFNLRLAEFLTDLLQGGPDEGEDACRERTARHFRQRVLGPSGV